MSSVTINITVILNDDIDPIITGADDISINLGDPNFSSTEGITANDNIDGDLTNQIVQTGKVNVWNPGIYVLTYTVEDEAGNIAEISREVTVSSDYVTFSEENTLVNSTFNSNLDGWLTAGATVRINFGVARLDVEPDSTLEQSSISGGYIDIENADYTLAKVVITARADTTRYIHLSIDQAATTTDAIILSTTMTQYVQYFRLSEILDGATLTIDLGSGGGTVYIDSIFLYLSIPAAVGTQAYDIPPTNVNLTIIRQDK